MGGEPAQRPSGSSRYPDRSGHGSRSRIGSHAFSSTSRGSTMPDPWLGNSIPLARSMSRSMPRMLRTGCPLRRRSSGSRASGARWEVRSSRPGDCGPSSDGAAWPRRSWIWSPCGSPASGHGPVARGGRPASGSSRMKRRCRGCRGDSEGAHECSYHAGFVEIARAASRSRRSHLLWVSPLERRKAPILVVRALAMTPDDVELWMVGAGPERPRLERIARELGVSGRIRFVGAVPRQELPGSSPRRQPPSSRVYTRRGAWLSPRHCYRERPSSCSITAAREHSQRRRRTRAAFGASPLDRSPRRCDDWLRR